ncbi:hypothetical protein [Psychroserpens sp.]
MSEDQTPKTVLELEQWMKDHCYNFISYSINGDFVYEGNGLEFYKGAYQWCSYDRSHKHILKRFKKETQAVAYAFNKITSDAWAKKNMVGMFKNDALPQILDYLKNRNIPYYSDYIHYQKDDWRTRVFVTGCDIKRVSDLIQKDYKNP